MDALSQTGVEVDRQWLEVLYGVEGGRDGSWDDWAAEDCGDYQGDDLQIGFNSRFIIEMLNNLTVDEVSLAMSLPNRAGIITPIDGTDEGELITMLVMPVMLND